MQSETKFVELVIVNDNSQVSHVAGNKLRFFRPGACFSKDPETFQVRRQILNPKLLNSCTVPSLQTNYASELIVSLY